MTDQDWLRRIPDDLIKRDPNANRDRERAIELLAYCEARGHRPTWFDLHLERQRRGTTDGADAPGSTATPSPRKGHAASTAKKPGPAAPRPASDEGDGASRVGHPSAILSRRMPDTASSMGA
jgi:hypothetical protein